METWDNVKVALMTVAAARFAEFVNELVPGCREQFQITGALPSENQSILHSVAVAREN